MTVPHKPVATVGKLELLHRREKHLSLQLDSLRKELPRTTSQHIRQRIVDLIGLTKADNVAILVHGVSLSLRGSGRLDTRLDTPPISGRHHPLSRIARCPASGSTDVCVDLGHAHLPNEPYLGPSQLCPEVAHRQRDVGYI